MIRIFACVILFAFLNITAKATEISLGPDVSTGFVVFAVFGGIIAAFQDLKELLFSCMIFNSSNASGVDSSSHYDKEVRI